MSTVTAPEWLGEPAPPRGRLLRHDAEAASVQVRGIDLPDADALDEHTRRAAPSDESDREGTAAIAWALGHREGYDAGQAAGRAEGLAEGTRQGRDAALAEGRRAVAETLQRIESQAEAHLVALDRVAERVAADATELAFAIAEAVIGRELQLAEDPGADALRRALAELPGRADAVARLHPDDLATLTVDVAQLANGRALELVPDPDLTPGDCVLESGATTIDATVCSALARVREVLGLPDDEGSA